jgi:hypothetical protein
MKDLQQHCSLKFILDQASKCQASESNQTLHFKKYTFSHLPKAAAFKQQKSVIFSCSVPHK